MTPLDTDELEALEAAATPGEWTLTPEPVALANSDGYRLSGAVFCPEDAAAIVALRNVAPELIRLAKLAATARPIIESAGAALGEAIEENTKLRAMLKAAEKTLAPNCIWCHPDPAGNHAPDCELAEALCRGGGQ